MGYPYVITLTDGKTETILSVRDFEYLIEKYMGHDALRFFRLFIKEIDFSDQ